MPFGQKFGSYLKTGFGNVKNFLGNAYTKTKDTLGSLDRTFGDIKKIYGTVAPALQDLAPEQAQGGLNKINQFMMKGVQGYENIRNKIDDAESQMIGKVGDVMSKVGGVQQKLKNQGYNFDFA
jgi:rRNA processing protein Gar1